MSTQFSTPSLEGLPDEILLTIFQHVRFSKSWEEPRETSFRDLSRMQNTGDSSVLENSGVRRELSIRGFFFDLALLSKCLHGPAIQVLYQTMEFDHLRLRMLCHTMAGSPALAGIIRRVTIKTPNAEYLPDASYCTAAQKIERQIEDRGRLLGLSHLVRRRPDDRALIPSYSLDSAVALSLTRKVTSLKISFVSLIDDGRGPTESPASAFRLLQGVANASDSGFARNLVRLELVGLHYCNDEQVPRLNEIAPVLRLRALRHLQLTRFKSSDTEDDLAAALVAKQTSSSLLRSLTLDRCSVIMSDMLALISICKQLEVFHWLYEDRYGWHAWYAIDARICYGLEDILSSLEPACKSIKMIKIDDFDWVSAWICAGEVFYPTFPHPGPLRESSFRILRWNRADFSTYASLAELQIPAPALIDLSAAISRQLVEFGPLPSSLRYLTVHLPYVASFDKCANSCEVEWPITPDQRTLEVLITTLCGPFNKLKSSTLPDLARVTLVVPSDWQCPSNYEGMLEAICAVRGFELVIEGNPHWCLDSSLSLSQALEVMSARVEECRKAAELDSTPGPEDL